MLSYYDLLNVDARASTAEIKKAFRERAKELHPDRNPGSGSELREQFAELAEAYEVLRDTGRRAQYDAARSATAAGPRGFPGGVYQPGVSEDAFEAAFRRWWEKAGADWQQRAEDEHHSRKSAAERRMEEAAAWEAEKAEAKKAKVRFERVKQKTRQARAARQAQHLRGMWQTRTVSWVDFAVAAAATAAFAGIVTLWKPLISPADAGTEGEPPAAAAAADTRQG